MGFFSRRQQKTPPRPLAASPPPIPVDTRPAALSSPPPQPQQLLPPPRYSPPQISGIIARDGSEVPYSDFQPAGYLPPPQGWSAQTLAPPPAYHQPTQQPPIVVNQHYYVYQGHRVQPPSTSNCPLTSLAADSVVHLANQVMPGVLPALREAGTNSGNLSGSHTDGPSNDSMNQLCTRFNHVMTLIDRERLCGNERDLFICRQDDAESSAPTALTTRGQNTGKPKKNNQTRKQSTQPKGQTTGVAASVISGNYFAKVELYANSRLPMNLPPLKLYIPTWPLLCLAAQYSEKVYDKARGKERDVQVEAGNGGRAMVIKSVPMDHMNTIVFAIRGTSTFMDWAVNLNTEPVTPSGFLDDDGNFCHAGFLSVARRMVKPVAARLRQLLQENPNRRSHSLIITGHSAGGAVAALLFSHMMSTNSAVRSELNSLTANFKRIHCITFGAPPISLLPLQKPSSHNRPELKKSLFISFVNEGDPVARADKAYVRSLLDLFATPAPAPRGNTTTSTALDKPPKCSSSLASMRQPGPKGKQSSMSLALSVKSTKSSSGKNTKSGTEGSAAASKPVWRLPPSTLSNAGRIIVLRSGDPWARLKGKKTVEERLNEGVVAQIATDEQLRTVVWGDPVCHLMKFYAGRLEILAVNAVTAKGY